MTPRPAATLVVVRAGSDGVEVLMLKRPESGFFGGLWVFPGGAVEAIDHSDLARSAVSAPDRNGDRPWRVAALRETVEEVGLALTDPPTLSPIRAHGAAVFETVIDRNTMLDGVGLRLLSQWVTPAGAPSRFDARFYLTVVEGDRELAPHIDEVVEVAWITPAEALAKADAGEWKLVTPTLYHLRWLAGHPDVDAVWSAAALVDHSPMPPVLASDGSEVRVQLPAAADLP